MIDSLFSVELKDRTATLTNIYDGSTFLDNCISIFYAAPRSYTGEDVIEIICHGNQIIINSIIELLNKAGVRNAEPGEFTKRAYLNNKISLLEAEAVADLISASDKKAVLAANNSLSGKFRPHISLRAIIVFAAFELTPPNPAPEGIFFFKKILHPLLFIFLASLCNLESV